MPEKEHVRQMFDAISGRYDVLNRLMSGGIDILWRKRALGQLGALSNPNILDVATGTGDLALAAAKRFPDARIIGLDLSQAMLAIAKKKGRPYPNIQWQQGEAEALPFDNHAFDVAMVAFGIRNFEHIEQGASELYRVLKPKGKLLILEFSPLKKGPIAWLFTRYFQYIVPIMGQLIAKNKTAYTYLPESVRAFYSPEAVISLFAKQGFRQMKVQALSWGIASLYLAHK